MGVVVHRYQAETPNTWRPEGAHSYLAVSLLHVVASVGLACLLTLIARLGIAFFGAGIAANLRFALCIWAALLVPIILESAVFVRLHRFVVVGQMLDWLTTSVLACAVTGRWLTR